MPGRGGRGGRVYQVAVHSLPAEIQERLKGLQGTVEGAFETHLPAPTQADFNPREFDSREVQARLDRLRTVLATEPGTPERALAIATAAAVGGIAEKTLRRWLDRHERFGIAGLARKRRVDAGEGRAITWLALDARLREAGRSDQEIGDLAEQIRRHVRGLLVSASASAAMVAQASIGFVAQQLRAAGGAVSQDELVAVCRPSAEFVQAERQARLVNVKSSDAARFAAKHVPRITRERSALLPMGWIAGDVSHLDVLIQRADGSTATPKAVAFQDLATNRLFYRLYLLAKGEGIRREHVLETFVAMCVDQGWGVPTRLVIDNGSEFKALDLAGDLFALKVAVEEAGFADPGVQRARPYNPQSKVIETSFSILNSRLLPMLPGFIGGNRMVKKTHNQGREPTPYPGTFEQLERDLATAIAFYHDKPQAKRSHLAGQSPNQRFREHVAAGWSPAVLVPDRLGAVFCARHARRVYAGGRFDLLGMSWRHDNLMPLAGRKVIVHEPLFGDRNRLFVFDEQDRELLCEAEPEQAFAWGDPAGAGEQRRRSAAHKRQIRKLAAQADPVDPVMAMAATNAEFGSAPVATAEQMLEPVPDRRRRAKRKSSLDLWIEIDQARKRAG